MSSLETVLEEEEAPVDTSLTGFLSYMAGNRPDIIDESQPEEEEEIVVDSANGSQSASPIGASSAPVDGEGNPVTPSVAPDSPSVLYSWFSNTAAAIISPLQSPSIVSAAVSRIIESTPKATPSNINVTEPRRTLQLQANTIEAVKALEPTTPVQLAPTALPPSVSLGLANTLDPNPLAKETASTQSSQAQANPTRETPTIPTKPPITDDEVEQVIKAIELAKTEKSSVLSLDYNSNRVAYQPVTSSNLVEAGSRTQSDKISLVQAAATKEWKQEFPLFGETELVRQLQLIRSQKAAAAASEFPRVTAAPATSAGSSTASRPLVPSGPLASHAPAKDSTKETNKSPAIALPTPPAQQTGPSEKESIRATPSPAELEVPSLNIESKVYSNSYIPIPQAESQAVVDDSVDVPPQEDPEAASTPHLPTRRRIQHIGLTKGGVMKAQIGVNEGSRKAQRKPGVPKFSTALPYKLSSIKCSPIVPPSTRLTLRSGGFVNGSEISGSVTTVPNWVAPWSVKEPRTTTDSGNWTLESGSSRASVTSVAWRKLPMTSSMSAQGIASDEYTRFEI